MKSGFCALAREGWQVLAIEQIAGSIARRISCPLKAGDPLRPGDTCRTVLANLIPTGGN